MSRTIAALLALCALEAAGTSFDCTRAATRIEKAICADPELGMLDEHLARYYAAARATLKEAGRCLQADQREWLKRGRDECRDKACLKVAYLDRLAELDALQPGVTAVKNLSLPRRSTLAWVVPPAADRVAAPPNPMARRFQDAGAIVDEVATGDGFVLRTDSGDRYLLVMLMFLDGETTLRLQQMARDPRARFVARGHLATDVSGRKYFEPSRCLFLYREP